ncbi:MAG: hypothetical protein WC747_03750 [Candidatus Babeliales bacterium]|jgi:hypothetical protein
MKSKILKLYLILMSTLVYGDCCVTDCPDTNSCDTPCSISKNTWLPRSFTSYSYRDISQAQYTYGQDFGDKEHHLNISLFTEYMQNFGGKCGSCKNLGAMPFWSGTNQMTIGNNDGKADLDAYQLGMGNVVTNADGIAGVIQLNPTVQSVGTDMMLYYVHSKQERGIYFKVHAPLAAMIVTPNLKELMVAHSDNEVAFSQVTAAAAGNPSSTITYEFPAYSSPLRRAATVSDVFFGGAPGSSLEGSALKPIHLRRGRISPCKQTIIRLGDITTAFGYNAYMSEKGFFGLGFKASLPTGNVPTGHYMLEPIVGRAGAWGLGGEISGSYRVWENCDQSKNLEIFVQGEVLHLMQGRTPNFRSFDLKQNGPGSKYLLVQNYMADYTNKVIPEATEVFVPQSLHSAINITTLPVISKIAVEGSFAVATVFNCDDWNVSLGGEFWGRSREKLQIDITSAIDQRLPNLNDYAVLGRQVSAYRVNGQPTSTVSPFNPIEVFYVEPLARINKSQDPVQLVGTLVSAGGLGIVTSGIIPDGIKDGRLSENRIPANLCEALDIGAAQASRAFTGKLFGQAGYTWTQHCHMPSLAVIGGVEFTSQTNNAIQLWSVGLQGSLNF